MGNLTNFFPAGSSSNIMEVVSGTCDGRSITVDSGTYTLPAVTGPKSLTTSYSSVAGSYISYTPPVGASHVLYKFDFQWDSAYSSGISHFKLLVDGVEVIKAYKCMSSNYSGNHGHHHGHRMESMFYNFDLTASSDDAANGKFSSWTTPKIIQVQAREYTSTYQAGANWNVYWSTWGSGVSYTQPTLTIKAFT